MSIFKSDIEKDLIEKISAVLESLELGLRDVEIIGNQNPTIRVTLDRLETDKDQGQIGIGDCEKAHRKLNPMFDLWDPVSGPYTLELSSPGESAPLRTSRHFEEALGESVKFQTLNAVEMPAPAKARKNWSGKLLSVNENEIQIEDDSGSYTIPLSDIKAAQWQRNWETKKQGKRR